MATKYTAGLPLKGDLRVPLNAFLAAAIGMGLLSLAGLMAPDQVYPSAALKQTFLSNDAVNLAVGLPAMLIPLWLAQRGSLAGLLCLPGGLAYVIYNNIAYAFGRPVDAFTAASALLVLVSAYAAIRLLRAIDHAAVGAQLASKAPVKFAGWVLLLFGLAFIGRAIGMLSGGALPAADIGVLIADLVISAAWVGGGILVLRRQPMGFSNAPGLLFSACALIAGLIAYFLVQPILFGTSFAAADVIVVAVFGLFCLLPFLRFMQGIGRSA